MLDLAANLNPPHTLERRITHIKPSHFVDSLNLQGRHYVSSFMDPTLGPEAEIVWRALPDERLVDLPNRLAVDPAIVYETFSSSLPLTQDELLVSIDRLGARRIALTFRYELPLSESLLDP